MLLAVCLARYVNKEEINGDMDCVKRDPLLIYCTLGR